MYWNDWSQDYKIERAWLDGTHREVVINNIGRSYGLTIDYVDRRLYWTDIDKKRIESADMEGRSNYSVVGASYTFWELQFFWSIPSSL